MKIIGATYCTLIVLFLLMPIFVLVPMSMGSSYIPEFPPTSWSLKQYYAIFNSDEWVNSALLSLRVALATTVLATTFGTMAAFALVRGNFSAKALFNGVLLAPRFVPIIISAVGFYAIFADLHLIGSEVALILAHTIIASPFVIIIVMATIRGFDRSLERASRNLGADQFQTFFRITLPLIQPGIVSSAIVAFIISFDEVVVSIFISGSRMSTLPKKMWDSLVFEIDPALPAISSIVLAITLILFLAVGWTRSLATPTNSRAGNSDLEDE